MILSLFGKSDDCLIAAEQKIYVNDIRELLFQNHDIAAAVTGYFTLEKEANRVRLTVQLKENQRVNSTLVEDLKNRLNSIYGDLIDVEFLPFHTLPHQMGIDFERKLNHLPS
jgi:phenylacetate-coenzyme A ligase PaaK-like adenylate-forming protein